jgi:hypothetical protein
LIPLLVEIIGVVFCVCVKKTESEDFKEEMGWDEVFVAHENKNRCDSSINNNKVKMVAR